MTDTLSVARGVSWRVLHAFYTNPAFLLPSLLTMLALGTFIGRLGTYRYLDMHQVIGESLDLAKRLLTLPPGEKWPSFSVQPM